MTTQKWFKVQYSIDGLINSNSDSLIMDVSGYSHIEWQEYPKIIYGAGHNYRVKSAFVKAQSLTALRAELKRVFGYNFEKYLFNKITRMYS